MVSTLETDIKICQKDQMKNQTKQMSLRLASIDDLDAVLRIEKECHVAPWTKEHFEVELEKSYSHFYVYTDDETDEEIYAYCVAHLLADEIQLLNIVVDFSYRGLGFAKKLMQQLIKDGFRDQCRRIFLEVRMSNENAIKLYEDSGFVGIHIRSNFYSNGEDALVMELVLSEGQSDLGQA